MWILYRCKTSPFLFLFPSFLHGAVAPLQVYCQRRHLQSVVIPDLISLAYLHYNLFYRHGTQLSREPNNRNVGFTRLSQSEIFFGVVFNLICTVFSLSWQRAKPIYFRDFVFGWFVVFGIPSTYSQFSSKRSTLGHCFESFCMWGDSVPNESLKRSILV